MTVELALPIAQQLASARQLPLGTIASFSLCAALLTVTPGADTVLVLTEGIRSGRRAALACALGVNTGLVCWAALTVGGLSALLAASPWAYACVRISGAAYLLWLGSISLARAVRRRHADRARPIPAPAIASGSGDTSAGTTPWRAFRRGVVTNLLNPKVGVFYVSLLPQFAPPGQRGPTLLLTLAAVHLVLSVAWLSAVGSATARAARSLSPRTVTRLEAAGAMALVGAGAVIAGAAL
ncbi:MAG TPA: LysE family translocator [Nocardioides sp.]|nr:LysE family translocator [Nocardioides sp.]